MSWQAIAERAAKARAAAILARIDGAIATHADGASVRRADGALHVRGSRLKQRWIDEPGLRFARWLP